MLLLTAKTPSTAPSPPKQLETTVFDLLHTLVALTPDAGGEGGGGIISLIVPFALVFGIMYFLVIRPQSKKQKEQESFLTSLKTGDQVVTQGGLFGKVTGVRDNVITLEISDRVRVKVLRSMILSRQESAPSEGSSESSSDKKDDKDSKDKDKKDKK